LREYPNLVQEDITQALAYTAWLAYEEVHPAYPDWVASVCLVDSVARRGSAVPGARLVTAGGSGGR
jgi:hypothetical protein